MCFIGYFTEVTINYRFLFYSFAADFLKHFVKWNLNYDWKVFQIHQNFLETKQSQYGRHFSRGTDDRIFFYFGTLSSTYFSLGKILG